LSHAARVAGSKGQLPAVAVAAAGDVAAAAVAYCCRHGIAT